MNTLERRDLEAFPDSPYAAELRRSSVEGPFGPALEAEYRKRHLDRVRLRVRMWFTLNIAFELYFGIDQLFADHNLTWGMLTHILFLIPSRAALVALVWVPGWYERWFTRAAPTLVAMAFLPVAALNAEAIAAGRALQMGTFVLFVIGIFSFCGLYHRTATFIGAAMVVIYVLSALVFGMSTPVVIVTTLVLALTCVIGVVTYREAEISDRTNLLEGGILRELVARDPLTSLMNRRAFDEHLLRIWQHAMRNNRPLSILMIDVDYFKNYNDAHGHQAGDSALRTVGQTLREYARRPLDLAARYGGEEFAIILYDLAPPYPHHLAEQIRAAVENLRITHESHPHSSFVTVSIGVATVLPSVGRTPEGALQLADEALYLAKEAGRNRTVVRERGDYELATGTFNRHI